MTFRVDGIGEIAWWLCGYAGKVDIIQPLELRERVREMHKNAVTKLEPVKKTPKPRKAPTPSTSPRTTTAATSSAKPKNSPRNPPKGKAAGKSKRRAS